MGSSDLDNERLRKFEEKLETSHRVMRETVAAEVGAAVKAAVVIMQQALINRVSNTLKEMSKQNEEKLASVVSHFEGQLTRSQETHESLISTMREDQLKFQSDVRSTLSSLNNQQSKVTTVGNHSVGGGLGFGEGSSSGGGKKGGGFLALGSDLIGGLGFTANGSGGGPGGGVGSGNGPTHYSLL